MSLEDKTLQTTNERQSKRLYTRQLYENHSRYSQEPKIGVKTIHHPQEGGPVRKVFAKNYIYLREVIA